jgi:imidazole glycerol-phosphate synthase subunit HisF
MWQQIRLIPCLLLAGRRWVKTTKFTRARYIGDPINAVRIYAAKQVKELMVLDITASQRRTGIDFKLIQQLLEECGTNVALCYGGHIKRRADVTALLQMGVKKIAINACSEDDIALISEIADRYGSQVVMAIMDIKLTKGGDYRVWNFQANAHTSLSPMAWGARLQKAGAGEIFLSSMDRDGTREGYDYTLIEATAAAVDIPVIAYGGANRLSDCVRVIKDTGAAAAAACTLFVYKGYLDAVVPNYPSASKISEIFQS